MNNKYAGFWRRFLASSVDGTIEVLLVWGLAFSLGLNPFDETKTTYQTIYQVISFILTTGFSILFWVNYQGATPGKKLMAIKVVYGGDGKQLNYGVAVIRYFGYFVSLIPLALGYIWIAFDSKKQGWHDKIAGTYVVKTDKSPRTGLAIFILIVSLIGFFITMGIIFKTTYDTEVQKITEKSQKEVPSNKSLQSQKGDEDKILSYAPSNCRLSVSVPKTEDTKDNKPRKWVYEELEADAKSKADNFRVLDPDTYSFTKSSVLFSNISYKNPQQLIGKNETSLAFPGINIWCTDNYKNLTLEEFKSLALLNKQLTVTETGGNFKWGEVEVIAVLTTGTLKDGFQIKEPGYIGVTKDGKKLLYMRIWDADPKDVIQDKLSEDIKLITRNLKYR